MNEQQIPCYTAEALGIGGVPYPAGFKPRFLAMDEGGVWHVHQTRPVCVMGGEWESDSDSYEIGIDDSDGLADTPAICRNLSPENSLFEIADSAQ